MTQESFELLSAFIDGEKVDTRELARTLGQPGAREALLDYTLLRADVQEDDSRPGTAFYEEMNRLLGQQPARGSWWRNLIPVPAPALAALVLMATVLAVWSGMNAIRQGPAEEATPPQPARVIHFENGVDWHAG